MRSTPRILWLSLLLAAATARGAEPFADVHVHYKWNQEEVTPPEAAVQILRDNHIALAVVIGMPAERALKLQVLAPEIIMPVWSPYRAPGDWSTWAFDKTVVQRARTALASGHYHGIGELHLIGGFIPDVDTPVIRALIELGIEHDVPLLLHTEFSQGDYLIELCRGHPRLRILWAHAGAVLPPAQVDEVMAACPNVWTELSARDPWRYVNNPVIDAAGVLLPAWRRLIESYPGRFLTGSDPVWPVERLDSWDEPDTGWEQYGRFINFHRTWLSALPPGVEEKVRLSNARVLFGYNPDRDQQ